MHLNSIRNYACGGCGTNIGMGITENENIEVIFVDTSDSNIKRHNVDKRYLVEGTDGAGKLRRTAYEAFKSETEAVLINFPPSPRLNIVTFSINGGSGSIIGPSLIKELLDRGLPVMVIAIGTGTSAIELTNGINTIKTLNQIVAQTQRPISLLPLIDGDRTDVDQLALYATDIFTRLTDRDLVDEFDTKDLYHFLNYNLVTSLPPSISLIDIIVNEEAEEAGDVGNNDQNRDAIIASSILLAHNINSQLKGPSALYEAKALIDVTRLDQKPGDEGYVEFKDLRIDNVVGNLRPILERMEAQLKETEDKVKASKLKLIDNSAKVEDDGFFVL